jgi:hypothetical protein
MTSDNLLLVGQSIITADDKRMVVMASADIMIASNWMMVVIASGDNDCHLYCSRHQNDSA